MPDLAVVFNKLVLLSVPLPCLIAAIQMGATCLMLLLVNGAVSALFHSRTKRVLTSTVHQCHGERDAPLPCPSRDDTWHSLLTTP